IAGLIMLFLSLGYPYRLYVYDKMPLLHFVRTNGHFRVFAILSFCCIAGLGLSSIEQHNRNLLPSFKKIHLLLGIVFLATLICIFLFEREDLYNFYTVFKNAAGFSERMKTFFVDVSLPVDLM